MGKVMNYVVQDKKTMFHDTDTGLNYRLISGQNCVAETTFKEFMATKIQHGKDNGVFYKQFVQSFKPGEAVTPKEIHQMGLELAEYFKGFEVLVATHIDEDHWHNHLIVNSVNVETGLKIQFNEKNLNQLRQRSDEICQSHGLETLQPYQKQSPVAGMNTREYRAAEKGNSWKFKLISAIDMAMEASRTKDEFIANMEQMSYGVKWIDHYKYITYTTPEGQKCRDNRLHEEKYLKERMTEFYEHRQIQGIESARQSAHATGKFVRGIQPENSVLRNPTGSAGNIGFNDDRNRKIPSTHAGADFETADMGRLDEGYSADSQQSNERTHSRRQSVREQLKAGVPKSDGHAEKERFRSGDEQNIGTGTNASSTGQYADKAAVEVDRDRISTSDIVIGAVVAIENLLAVNDQPKEKEQKKQVVERKNRQKKKQHHEHDWEMSL